MWGAGGREPWLLLKRSFPSGFTTNLLSAKIIVIREEKKKKNLSVYDGEELHGIKISRYKFELLV